MENTKQSVMNDPCTSRYVRELLTAASNRDIVDSINDLEIVLDVLNNELNAAVKA